MIPVESMAPESPSLFGPPEGREKLCLGMSRLCAGGPAGVPPSSRRSSQ
jgi:hypothetical protein